MANNELLKSVLAYILDNPEKWDQNHWAKVIGDKKAVKVSCGTAFCFAGTVLALTQPDALMVDGYQSLELDELIFRSAVIPGLGEVEIDGYAAEQLDLGADQADALFDGDNKLPRILRMVAALLEDADADLWDVA